MGHLAPIAVEPRRATRFARRSRARRESIRSVEPSIALRYFGAATIAEAVSFARGAIDGAARCHRCHNVLERRIERIGSTLFYDDDPRALIRSFDPDDRDGCTLRLLAACIILYGRARERCRLHDANQP